MNDLAEGQEAAVIRMRSALNITLADITAAQKFCGTARPIQMHSI